MDTIPLPTRKYKKGPQAIRASRKQSEILLNLFAQTPVASSESINSVSEETGLPKKWINSWFIRQRRKARDAATTVQDAMSTDAIDKFKAEYQDPVQVDTSNDGLAQRGKLSRKGKARPGSSKRIKTEYEDTENVPLNITPLPIPPPTPPSLPTSSIEMDKPDAVHPSSRFILREMIPRVWIPPGSNCPPTLGPSTSNSNATAPAAQNECLPRSSAYTTPQTQISDVRTVLQPAFFNIAPHTARFPQGTHAHIPETVPVRVQDGMSGARRYPVLSDPYRNVPGYWRHYQQQSRPHQTSNLGPGRVPDCKLQASYNMPFSAPFVFANGLTSSLHPAAYHRHLPTSDGIWPSRLMPPLITDPGPGREVMQVMDRPAQLPQQNYNPLLDPSTTPLKYLTVLEPLERCFGTNRVYTTFQQDTVLDRLLDENLAQNDPFQAAMGLVFLSRLGLEWEY